MPKWSKAKAKLETVLPPLTTEQDERSTTPNWHQIKMVEGSTPTSFWTVIWDTRRQPDAFNTAHHKAQEDAVDCAKRFLRLGFLVYSIRDPDGVEIMDEAAIGERLKPTSAW
jgi:hypothetical protein